MSTFVRKAEEAITSKQPERGSFSNHKSHSPDPDLDNNINTDMLSDRGVITIYTKIIAAEKIDLFRTSWG
jgi:hypothetical protein